ncbi:MAG TPA: sporulation protein YhbH [Clostridia bacterium]|nr:sporulation protein YhbH [Clostridia bacterium]
MAIFRDYDPGGKERSAEDRRRHKELVEESIKKNIGSIISEESIIGQSGSKKIKIPVRGIKEYSFVYGKNAKGAATGDGDEKRGDVVGEDAEGKNFGHGGAGDQEGEDIYETEITIEELVNYLFDDLDLPDLDRKRISEIESDNGFRKLGYQRKGIPPRLAKRRTVIEKIKRKQAFKRNMEADEGLQQEDEGLLKEEEGLQQDGEGLHKEGDRHEVQQGTIDADGGMDAISSPNGTYKERFPFMEDDLRYRRLKETHKKDFNAVVLCIMDVSGSMDQTKKYMARSFYFLLYQFLRLKYSNVEVVFIAHTTTAKEVGEVEFFHKGESGGTYISSGYAKALEIIEQRYNPRNWNIYAFHCSDGDNWTEDNKKAVELALKLCEVCNLFGYGEIVPGYYFAGSTVKSEFIKNISNNNFIIVTMSRKDDIVTGLKRLLEKDGEKA